VKVAIAGAGNVGQFIANDLAVGRHEVLIIEQDPGVVSRSAPALTGPRGDGAASSGAPPTPARSPRCGRPTSARSTWWWPPPATTKDNLVISLLAKQEFAVPRVVARVNHPKNEWLFNENWASTCRCRHPI